MLPVLVSFSGEPYGGAHMRERAPKCRDRSPGPIIRQRETSRA